MPISAVWSIRWYVFFIEKINLNIEFRFLKQIDVKGAINIQKTDKLKVPKVI
jgi:hypothetical protein